MEHYNFSEEINKGFFLKYHCVATCGSLESAQGLIDEIPHFPKDMQERLTQPHIVNIGKMWYVMTDKDYKRFKMDLPKIQYTANWEAVVNGSQRAKSDH